MSPGQFTFRTRALLKLTLVVAVYCAAFTAKGEDAGLFLFFLATVFAFGLLAIGADKVTWTGFLAGTATGLVVWVVANWVEPFLNRDRLFYLILYTSIFAFAGMAVGFVWSRSRRRT